ncbi:hypoxanthine phosphoribosyltransferase [Desulforhabdus amnigena]|jgi:hypoxanthine phosphoribosyltransferase|uniref:Hypoxanthine phosphoribosyltransferase n=1 Tax=Desulforhabdus amnigena TaxID=40218 RepID=A0A9W6D0L4_9BACT|nr:hypoxanthine phosphoribosyltransferase [Desulforhabdus amnigena]NLJ28879.1 hypoxanthine phosphoribosyltransferase [Deltaproteobacteria bacterium]GLI33103.1 hypoxanthine phosphoribosyltransferase [Desulforhabdus amnigena]
MEEYQLVPRIKPEELQKRLDDLAVRINRDYEGTSLIIIGVLKGAFIFLADMVRRLSIPVEVDFVRLASYGESSETSGKVKITKDIELSIKDRNVLIVEDIVDTGLTIAWYLDHLRQYHPESIKVCALIDKFERRQVEVPIDYAGIRLEKGFLVGYGLDFSEKHRNLPGIYEVQFQK